jgi:serine/threonine-protein kinase
MPGKSAHRIGRYEIESELGRGGFGKVYKAFDPTVGRRVAIKLLSDVDAPEAIDRFRAEAMAAGNLHHPNVLTIYDYGEHEGSAYIVMEYLEGQDLQEIIAAKQPLSLMEKVRIMVQAAEALAHAHQSGVVHRDVKPSNIRLLPTGEVKVMDFGIARLIHGSEQRLTHQGLVIGTIRYISPEQLQGHDADALSDIFAYGLVFYELLSGQYPFDAPDLRGLMFRITTAEPVPVSQVAAGCPPALEHVVMRALEKDREKRYLSFDELLSDLSTVLRDLQREQAAELFAQARDHFDSQRFVESQAAIRNILELDPYHREARKLREAVQSRIAAMSVQSRVEAIVKSAEDQISRQMYSEAKASLESALRLSPASVEAARLLDEVVRRTREQQQRSRLEQSKSSPELTADRTVVVDPQIADLPPPAPPDRTAEPPREVTRYFKISGRAEPLKAYLTIVGCPDPFREGQTIPIESSRLLSAGMKGIW